MDPIKTAAQSETKLHFLDYWRIIRIRKTIILAVFLLVVITATLVTFILPESYSSTARIVVARDATDIAPMMDPRMMPSGYDPYFILTEFEVLRSEKILDKVIDNLGLNEAWAKKYGQEGKLKTEETRSLLKKAIDLRPTRNTSMIEITAYSDRPKEAADIANAVADEYEKYRLEKAKKQSMGGIGTLKEEFDKHEKKVRDKQVEVDGFRKEFGVSDLNPGGEVNSSGPSDKAETFRRYESIRVELSARLSQEEAQLSKLKSMDPKEQAQSLPTALPLPDMRLNELLAQRIAAQQTLEQKLKDYGPEHAEVLKVKASLETNEKQTAEAVKGILSGLETRVAQDRAGLSNVVMEVEAAKKADLDNAQKTRPYYVAKRELDELIAFRRVLTAKLASENIDVQLPKSPVDIVDRATPGLTPVRPNKPLNIALGVVVGLVVGIGLAFFIEYLDTSVKTIDDVERALGCAVLGVIPQNVGYILYEGTESPHAEAYRVLRTNLLFSRKDDKLNSICVVSAGAGEGKTTTAINLATVFAQGGQRVLLVDSDLRRPTLHKLIRVSNNIGLTSFLLKQNTLEEVIQTTSMSTLDFLPSGKLPSSSLGILSSPQMKELISELKQRYDFVVFDSPPMMGVSDASVLASEVDLTMQVIQYRRYPQPMNIRAKQMIEKVGGTLIGIVLNNINMSQDESYYYYSGYYHDYYYSKKEDEPDAKTDKGAGEQGPGEKAKGPIKQKY